MQSLDNSHNPLLSITIPTFNRANFLKSNLEQLNLELQGIEKGLVEIIISDNCSEDNTEAIVENAITNGLAINYIRNEKNIGWGANFFQCFNLARGHYVLILSDDDLLVDGGLKIIISHILEKKYGVICLRAYGFNDDFRKECPSKNGKEYIFSDLNNFLIATTPQITLLSACIINKYLIKDLDTQAIVPGNFAHLHLILKSMFAAKQNLYIDKYLIAAKRDNSSNYSYSKVFVEELWHLFEHYSTLLMLKPSTIKRMAQKMIFSYYPADVLRLRLENNVDLKVVLGHFANRFNNNFLFNVWVAPILKLPRFLAIIWGIITTLIGKIYSGEYKTILLFLWIKLKSEVYPKGWTDK